MPNEISSTPSAVPDASTASSPVTNSSSPSADFQLAPDKSLADNFSEFTAHRAALKDSSKEASPEVNNQPVENQDLSSSEPDTSRDGSNLPAGAKKRIDKLTAKYRQEQEAHKNVALENAKLKEALRLYEAELGRVSSFAKLDPQQEEIQRLKIEKEIMQIDQRIPQEIEERFSQSEQEYSINEKAQEIYSDIQSQAQAWENLFSPFELAQFMKQNNIYSPEVAAKQLGEQRLSVASKRMKAPQAPTTASSNSSGTRETAQAWRYEGQNTISEFLRQQESLRTGRK